MDRYLRFHAVALNSVYYVGRGRRGGIQIIIFNIFNILFYTPPIIFIPILL
jgi:hypothetical protein